MDIKLLKLLGKGKGSVWAIEVNQVALIFRLFGLQPITSQSCKSTNTNTELMSHVVCHFPAFTISRSSRVGFNVPPNTL